MHIETAIWKTVLREMFKISAILLQQHYSCSRHFYYIYSTWTTKVAKCKCLVFYQRFGAGTEDIGVGKQSWTGLQAAWRITLPENDSSLEGTCRRKHNGPIIWLHQEPTFTNSRHGPSPTWLPLENEEQTPPRNQQITYRPAWWTSRRKELNNILRKEEWQNEGGGQNG